jgi:hypothetical protein
MEETIVAEKEEVAVVAEPATEKLPEDVFVNVSEANYPGWTKAMSRMGEIWVNKGRGIFVAFGGKIIDGKHWVMASVFRKSKLPSFDDLLLAKKTFFTDQQDSLILLPGSSTKYFSSDQSTANSIRIVSCLEGDGLPKFF